MVDLTSPGFIVLWVVISIAVLTCIVFAGIAIKDAVAGDDAACPISPSSDPSVFRCMFSNDCGLHGKGCLTCVYNPLDPIHSEGEGATTFPALNNPANSFLSTPEGFADYNDELLTGVGGICVDCADGKAFCPCNTNNECAPNHTCQYMQPRLTTTDADTGRTSAPPFTGTKVCMPTCDSGNPNALRTSCTTPDDVVNVAHVNRCMQSPATQFQSAYTPTYGDSGLPPTRSSSPIANALSFCSDGTTICDASTPCQDGGACTPSDLCADGLASSCAGVAVFGADGTTIEYPCATNASGGESPTSCYCRVGCGIQEYMSNIYCEDRPDGLTECDLNGDHVAEGYNYYGTCVEPKAACGTSCSTNKNCEQATLGTNMGETCSYCRSDVNNVFAVGEALSYDKADGDADLRTLGIGTGLRGVGKTCQLPPSCPRPTNQFSGLQGSSYASTLCVTDSDCAGNPNAPNECSTCVPRSFYPVGDSPATAVTAFAGPTFSMNVSDDGGEDYQTGPNVGKNSSLPDATSGVPFTSASDAPSAGQSQCLLGGCSCQRTAGSPCSTASDCIYPQGGSDGATVCSPNISCNPAKQSVCSNDPERACTEDEACYGDGTCGNFEYAFTKRCEGGASSSLACDSDWDCNDLGTYLDDDATWISCVQDSGGSVKSSWTPSTFVVAQTVSCDPVSGRCGGGKGAQTCAADADCAPVTPTCPLNACGCSEPAHCNSAWRCASTGRLCTPTGDDIVDHPLAATGLSDCAANDVCTWYPAPVEKKGCSRGGYCATLGSGVADASSQYDGSSAYCFSDDACGPGNFCKNDCNSDGFGGVCTTDCRPAATLDELKDKYVCALSGESCMYFCSESRVPCLGPIGTSGDEYGPSDALCGASGGLCTSVPSLSCGGRGSSALSAIPYRDSTGTYQRSCQSVVSAGSLCMGGSDCASAIDGATSCIGGMCAPPNNFAQPCLGLSDCCTVTATSGGVMRCDSGTPATVCSFNTCSDDGNDDTGCWTTTPAYCVGGPFEGVLGEYTRVSSSGYELSLTSSTCMCGPGHACNANGTVCSDTGGTCKGDDDCEIGSCGYYGEGTCESGPLQGSSCWVPLPDNINPWKGLQDVSGGLFDGSNAFENFGVSLVTDNKDKPYCLHMFDDNTYEACDPRNLLGDASYKCSPCSFTNTVNGGTFDCDMSSTCGIADSPPNKPMQFSNKLYHAWFDTPQGSGSIVYGQKPGDCSENDCSMFTEEGAYIPNYWDLAEFPKAVYPIDGSTIFTASGEHFVGMSAFPTQIRYLRDLWVCNGQSSTQCKPGTCCNGDVDDCDALNYCYTDADCSGTDFPQCIVGVCASGSANAGNPCYQGSNCGSDGVCLADRSLNSCPGYCVDSTSLPTLTGQTCNQDEDCGGGDDRTCAGQHTDTCSSTVYQDYRGIYRVVLASKDRAVLYTNAAPAIDEDWTPVVLLDRGTDGVAQLENSLRIFSVTTQQSSTSLPEWIIVAAYHVVTRQITIFGFERDAGGTKCMNSANCSRTHPYCRTSDLDPTGPGVCCDEWGFTGDGAGSAGLWKCVQNTPLFWQGLAPAGSDAWSGGGDDESTCAPGTTCNASWGFGNTPIKLNQVAIETLFENDAAPQVLSTNMVLHGSNLLIGLVESYWFSNASFRENPGNAENEIASTVVSLVFCPGGGYSSPSCVDVVGPQDLGLFDDGQACSNGVVDYNADSTDEFGTSWGGVSLDCATAINGTDFCTDNEACGSDLSCNNVCVVSGTDDTPTETICDFTEDQETLDTGTLCQCLFKASDDDEPTRCTTAADCQQVSVVAGDSESECTRVCSDTTLFGGLTNTVAPRRCTEYKARFCVQADDFWTNTYRDAYTETNVLASDFASISILTGGNDSLSPFFGQSLSVVAMSGTQLRVYVGDPGDNPQDTETSPPGAVYIFLTPGDAGTVAYSAQNTVPLQPAFEFSHKALNNDESSNFGSYVSSCYALTAVSGATNSYLFDEPDLCNPDEEYCNNYIVETKTTQTGSIPISIVTGNTTTDQANTSGASNLGTFLWFSAATDDDGNDSLVANNTGPIVSGASNFTCNLLDPAPTTDATTGAVFLHDLNSAAVQFPYSPSINQREFYERTYSSMYSIAVTSKDSLRVDIKAMPPGRCRDATTFLDPEQMATATPEYNTVTCPGNPV